MQSRQHLRHEMAIRRLAVVRRRQLAPTIVRITLGGAELAGFTAPGPNDHVKVFFPDPTTGTLTTPAVTADGIQRPADAVIISRDFTPRAFRDAATGPELDIDFVLHGAVADGPAASWASSATIGDELGVAGPRGSRLAPDDAARLVLIADETALPAFSRWLELVPASVPVTAVLEVEDEDVESYLTAEQTARASIEWLYRVDGSGQLEESVRSLEIDDDTYIWAAGEAGTLVAVRRYLRQELGLGSDRLAVEGYWKRGITNLDHHAPIDPSDPD